MSVLTAKPSEAAASSSASSQVRTAGRPNLVFGGNYGENVDPSRWVVMYPPYIDAGRKESEGRKIAKEKCVQKPTMVEMFDCAQLLGFQSALELDKAYCRDYWQRGRVRIRLFDEEKRLVREDIPNRRTLYAKVAGLIPQHREKTAAKASQPKKSGGGKNAGGKGSNPGKGQAAQPRKKKKGKR